MEKSDDIDILEDGGVSEADPTGVSEADAGIDLADRDLSEVLPAIPSEIDPGVANEIIKFTNYKIPLAKNWRDDSPFKLVLNVYVSLCTTYGAVEIVIISCNENLNVRNALYSKMRHIRDNNKTKDKYGTVVRHCCIRGCYIIGKRNFISKYDIRSYVGKTLQITIDNIGYKQFTIGSKYCVCGKYDLNFFPKLRISKIRKINIANKDVLISVIFKSLKQRKKIFDSYIYDIEAIFNPISELNWLKKRYLCKTYGEEFKKKFRYIGLNYYPISKYDDDIFEKLVNIASKEIEPYKKAIDVLYHHKYFCISINCFTCNLVYKITKDFLSKTIDKLLR
jgi:hypothetical protein